MVGSLTAVELQRALRVVLERLMYEAERADADLADRLATPLNELMRS